MPGRGESQRARVGVEQHDHQRDELLDAVGRRHLGVELLERLGRVAVLAQEDTEEVLGLEGGDRRLDAPAGDVADDRGDARRGDAEHVVEVAGHDTGTGLVDPAELEAREVGQVLGRQPLGPALGGELLLAEHLLGPALEVVAVLGQAGLPGEVAAVGHRQGHGNQDQEEEQAGDALTGQDHAARGESEHAVEARGVQVLAERGSGEHRHVGIAAPLGLDALPHHVQTSRRPGPDTGSDQ